MPQVSLEIDLTYHCKHKNMSTFKRTIYLQIILRKTILRNYDLFKAKLSYDDNDKFSFQAFLNIVVQY